MINIINNFYLQKNNIIKSEQELMDKYLKEFNQRPGNASSLEQCCFLKYIIENSKLKTFLDTGSGISTVFLRKYKSQEHVTHTYESKKIWIEQVKFFLNLYNLDDENIYHVFDNNNKIKREFIDNSLKYDFIYHDLGNIEERIETLPVIINKLNVNGYILFDDMHFADQLSDDVNLNKAVFNLVGNDQFEFIDTKPHTLDVFGRFAYMFKRLY